MCCELLLPRPTQRGSDYSDVYDGDQPDAESGLLINPAVAAVVASKAVSVSSPIVPAILQTPGARKLVREDTSPTSIMTVVASTSTKVDSRPHNECSGH